MDEQVLDCYDVEGRSIDLYHSSARDWYIEEHMDDTYGSELPATLGEMQCESMREFLEKHPDRADDDITFAVLYEMLREGYDPYEGTGAYLPTDIFWTVLAKTSELASVDFEVVQDMVSEAYRRNG